jgi:LCP family protein required for cell wall assembly
MKSYSDPGAGVRSPQRIENSPNMSNYSQRGGANHSGTSTNNRSQSTNSTRKKILIVAAYILVGLFGLTIGGGLYAYKIYSTIGHANTQYIDSAEAEENLPIDLNDLDAEEITNGDTSSSWADGGHTKVFVDEDFPIVKVKQKDKNVENILVFGVDSRGSDDVKCRADAVMIVSLDGNTKSIKLISLMRDTSVTIKGRDTNDKLTHSYAYGGVGLLINTINENYGLDIQRFVMFDFNSSSNLIDLIGGIYIDVQANEVKYANQSINEQNELTDESVPFLTQSGVQTLSGAQSVAWARIRHADSDFVRSSRQRAVATALVQKISGQNQLVQLSILEDSAGMFETNMTQSDLIRIGSTGVKYSDNIIEYRIPDDGLFTVQQSPWMMVIDWENQIPLLHEYIWGKE